MKTQGKWSRIVMACLIVAWAGNLYAQLSGDLAISFVPVPGDKPSGAAPAGVTANPDIDISPLSRDYGNVAVGSSSDYTFKVSNKGLGSLVISAVSGSGPNPDQFALVGPGEPLPPPYTLPPFLTIGITVSFRPTSAGVKRASIQVTSNDPDEGSVTVQLSGTGVGPDITISPTAKNYGNVLLGASSSQNFVISNSGAATLNVTSISLTGADPGQFRIDSGGGSFSLSAGSSRTVAVSYRPTAPGAKSATLHIASNDTDENPLAVALTGTGVAPDIAVSPTSKNFGQVFTGSTASQTFVVSNNGTANLSVTATTLIGTAPTPFSIASGGGAFTLPAGATRNLKVTFRPSSIGEQKATLRIAHNDSDENPLDLLLIGTGVEPNIVVRPDQLDFGHVLMDSGFVRVLSIKNSGTAELRLTALHVAGPDSSLFTIESSDSSFALAPADSKQVAIRFQPGSPGRKEATLRLASNDPDTPQLDIPLGGDGVVPEISVAPDSVDFGLIAMDSSATQILLITNRGRADLFVTEIVLVGADSAQFEILGEGGLFILAPDSTHVLTLVCHPARVGALQAAVHIESNDPAAAALNVLLVGTGAAPILKVRPQTYDFAAVLPGQTTAAQFWLINSGDADLMVHSIVIAGPDSSDFKAETATSLAIPPMDSSAVAVRFSPVTLGAKSATLRLFCNDRKNSPADIPLTGLCSENSAPCLVYFFPADSAREIPGNSPVQFKIADIGAGIDVSSLTVEVAGVTVVKNGVDLAGGRVAVHTSRTVLSLIYFPETPYPTDSVVVIVQCSDKAIPANVLNVRSMFRTGAAAMNDLFTQRIGPEGGSCADPNSGLQVTVPPAVLTDSLHVVVAETAGHPPLPQGVCGIGTGYYLAPEGLAFSDSIVVRLPYASGTLREYGVENPLHLRIYHYSTFGGDWRRLLPFQADSSYVYVKMAEFCYLMPATGAEEIASPLYLNGPEAVQTTRPAAFFVHALVTSYGHDLEYQFNWGDGSRSAWSADTLASHVWTIAGAYEVSVVGRCAADTTLKTSSNVLSVRTFIIAGVDDPAQSSAIPSEFGMQQNYPNPFNPSTTINFQIPSQQRVTITVYDLLGKKVKTLMDEEKPAGYYQVMWDTENQRQQKMASGVYLCHLSVPGYTRFIKMLLLR